jgi:sulfur carrier protein
MTLTITVNGESRDLPTGATVASVVELFSAAAQGRGVAVAVGGEVVPRTDWSQTQLCDGDQVEVVAAVQGG